MGQTTKYTQKKERKKEIQSRNFFFFFFEKHIDHEIKWGWMKGKFWKKLAFVPFKKTIQHFAPLPKLIREMSLFWNSIFSKSS